MQFIPQGAIKYSSIDTPLDITHVNPAFSISASSKLTISLTRNTIYDFLLYIRLDHHAHSPICTQNRKPYSIRPFQHRTLTSRPLSQHGTRASTQCLDVILTLLLCFSSLFICFQFQFFVSTSAGTASVQGNISTLSG